LVGFFLLDSLFFAFFLYPISFQDLFEFFFKFF